MHLQSGAVAAWSADRTPWWTCLQTPKRWTCCRSTPQLEFTWVYERDEWRGRRKERKKEWWYWYVHLQSGAVAAWSADRTPWWTCLQTPKRWTCCRSTPQLTVLPLWKRMSGGVEERKERKNDGTWYVHLQSGAVAAWSADRTPWWTCLKTPKRWTCCRSTPQLTYTASMKEDEWRGRRKERKKEWWYWYVHLQSGAVAAWSADRTPWWTCHQTPKRWTCCRSTPQLSLLHLLTIRISIKFDSLFK